MLIPSSGFISQQFSDVLNVYTQKSRRSRSQTCWSLWQWRQICCHPRLIYWDLTVFWTNSNFVVMVTGPLHAYTVSPGGNGPCLFHKTNTSSVRQIIVISYGSSYVEGTRVTSNNPRLETPTCHLVYSQFRPNSRTTKHALTGVLTVFSIVCKKWTKANWYRSMYNPKKDDCVVLSIYDTPSASNRWTVINSISLATWTH